jgi:transcriptional regulator GlxA family with amidase domain
MIHASLIAIPECGASLIGAFELLSSVGTAWKQVIEQEPPEPLFRAEIVSEQAGALDCSENWTVRPHATIERVAHTDVVFIPSLWIGPDETLAGRHSALKQWIVDRYQDGAIICAACTGTFLLADTGMLDDEMATTHWAYVDSLRRHYPKIKIRGEKVLVEAGADSRLITSGSHATWYDLLLYVISRLGGRDAALQTGKFFLLQWHTDGQSPYMAFRENLQHGDAVIRQAQEWLSTHYSHPNVVTALEEQSGLPSRTFKRRFKQATGLTPMAYVQEMRVDRAKALLESSDTPVDQIGWRVGYEDVTYFRRLFKRVTSLRPGEYRKKFQLPVSNATGR